MSKKINAPMATLSNDLELICIKKYAADLSAAYMMFGLFDMYYFNINVVLYVMPLSLVPIDIFIVPANSSYIAETEFMNSLDSSSVRLEAAVLMSCLEKSMLS